MSSQKTRSRTAAGDLHEACLREALVIIGDSGVEALSLREVARRLGVSHQAPYKHFSSRDHLLAEIVRRSFAEFALALDSRPLHTDPHQNLHAMGEAYLDYAFRYPLHYRLMFGSVLPNPEAHPDMMQSASHAFSQLREALLIVHGGPKKSGAKRAAELDSLYVWSVMHGLASLVQTEALSFAGLPKVVLDQAIGHVMSRIGTGLAGPQDL